MIAERGTIDMERDIMNSVGATTASFDPRYLSNHSPPVGGFPSPIAIDRSEATIIAASRTARATPTSDYHWRAPSPPHIHIPPTPDNKQILLPYSEVFIDDRSNWEILKKITERYHSPRPTDWKYEWRRQAQQVLSFLYLGPSVATKNVEFLEQEGITMLLLIRDSKSATGNFLSGEKIAKQLGIEAKHVDVTDTQHLTHRLKEAVMTINDHLISQYKKKNALNSDDRQFVGGKVLVFCESGNERSATVVAAYLMAMYSLNIIGAIQYIQAQRFCVAFDDSLKNLLLSFQQMVEAEKMISRAQSQVQVNSKRTKAKRSRDDMDDDMDVEMDEADDNARFDGRRVFAPFRDNGNATTNDTMD